MKICVCVNRVVARKDKATAGIDAKYFNKIKCNFATYHILFY